MKRDYFLNNLYLGQSKDVIEKRIGAAYYQHTSDTDIVEKIYIFKNFILRAYFKDDHLISYFLTLRNDVKIEFPKQYSHLVNDKELGDFTYYEIDGSPSFVEAYLQQGTGHFFYVEKYYFASFGNYYDFYFLHLDYGIDNNLYTIDENVFFDEEIDKNKIGAIFPVMMRDRKKSYPNTYGICEWEYSEEVYDMISNYSNYDLSSIY